MLSIVTIRSSLHNHKYSLTNTVEALEADPNPITLKNKRKLMGNTRKHHITTKNLEFLKEVNIKLNLIMILLTN